MPKIIENLPQRLMDEARRQIEESGFSAMTIRSVAKGCGVGVGTVYNYYPSKEMLVASFMLEDWQRSMANIHRCAASSQHPEAVMRSIYDQLLQFMQRYEPIFRDESAAASFAGSFSRYHGTLRSQLATPVRKFCRDDFTAEFLAEALLTWTVAGKDFEELKAILLRII